MEYRYIGDIKKLIPNGWVFHKLFANNYKVYNKNNIWMYVISKMRIEIDNITSNEIVIDFILENKSKPDSFWTNNNYNTLLGNYTTPLWTLFEGKIISTKELREKKREMRKKENPDSCPITLVSFEIFLPLVNTILELQNLGGIIKK